MTICSWWSDAIEKLSADRATRAWQSTNAGRKDFEIERSIWTIHIGQDVAVLLEGVDGKKEYQLGRVCRIHIVRREYGDEQKRWVNYLKPIDLEECKKRGLSLWFQLAYYTRDNKHIKGRKGKQIPSGERYEYARSQDRDPAAIHLTMVICPVALEYHRATNRYYLPESNKNVIAKNLKGGTYLIEETEEGEYDEAESRRQPKKKNKKAQTTRKKGKKAN
jgi:hypothetical protein